MYTVEIDLKGIKERLDPARIYPRLRAGFAESTQYLTAEVQKMTAVDSGRARGSIVPGLRGTDIPTLRGTVGSAEAHVFVMDQGRRPGMRPPPTAPIRLWLRRHGLDEKLAFVVARSIGKKGSFHGGLHMFDRAATTGLSRVQAIISRHLEDL